MPEEQKEELKQDPNNNPAFNASIGKDNAPKIETPKKVVSVCTVSIDDIFRELHQKAETQTDSAFPDYTVINSSIEGEGTKANFSGPGQHIILAVLNDVSIKHILETKDIKDTCFKAIQNYVQWFCGPDSANADLTINSLKPQTQPLTEEDKKFLQNEPKKEDSVDGEEKKDDEDSVDGGEEAPEDLDTDNEQKDEEEEEEPSKPTGESFIIVNSLLSNLFESSQEEDFEIADGNGEKVVGYYITFTIEVGNQKKTSLDFNWKRLGKIAGNVLGGLGIEIVGLTHDTISGTVGDVAKALTPKSKIIDPDKLKSEFESNFKKKYSTIECDITILDSPAVISLFTSGDDARLTSEDIALLKKTTNSLVIKLNNEKGAGDLITKQDIANIINKSLDTKSFGGMVTENKVSKKDVIFINNIFLELPKKDKRLKQNKPVKRKEAPKKVIKKESFSFPEMFKYNLLSEADDKSPITIEDVQKEFKTQCKTEFGTGLVKSDYNTVDNITSYLKTKKVDVSSIDSNVENYFMIDVNGGIQAESISKVDDQILSILFEADEDKETTERLNDAKTVLKTTIDNISKKSGTKIEEKDFTPTVLHYKNLVDVEKDSSILLQKLKKSVSFKYKDSVFAGIFDTEEFNTLANEKRMNITKGAIKTKYVIAVKLKYLEDDAINILTEDYKLNILKGNEKSEITKVSSKFGNIIKSTFSENMPGKVYSYRNRWDGDNFDKKLDTLFIFTAINKYDDLLENDIFLLPDENKLAIDSTDQEGKVGEDPEDFEMKNEKTGYDGYIVPMKNLKYETKEDK